MKCPYCNEADTKVIDSRPAEDNSSIRRRRQCERCGKRFTTYEKLETMPLMVIKKDNSREAYDRSKIEAGIIQSCHKRPVSTQQINSVIDEIENRVFNMEEKEVPTSVIGELVMDKLKELDEVAYVRFASVYREFKDEMCIRDRGVENLFCGISLCRGQRGDGCIFQLGFTAGPVQMCIRDRLEGDKNERIEVD